MKGQLYLLDNQILNIKKWEKGIDSNPMAFATAPFWVQVWNLPVHWVTKEIGWKIGSLFESVEDVIIPSGGSREGRHLKLKVLLDTTLPLLRGTTATMKGVTRWIEFRYERCPDFYYYCGRIGHNDKVCNQGKEKSKGSNKPQFRPWMRAQVQRNSPKKPLQAKKDRHSEYVEKQNQISNRLLFEGEYVVNNRNGNQRPKPEIRNAKGSDIGKQQEKDEGSSMETTIRRRLNVWQPIRPLNQIQAQ